MRIDIITVQPNLLKSPFENSIIKRAVKKKLADIYLHDLREYGLGNYRQIDDYPYGGGAGMVLMVKPIANCIESLQAERTYNDVIYMTPDAKTLNQATANSLSLKENIIILTGHYKGVDQRVRDKYITKEISIGDYVLTGGELAAAVLCDAIIRLIPGVLGDETSALTDSFQDNLLAPPIYTRPASFKGMEVPEILLLGNFQKIEQWRIEQAFERTKQIRPDLLNKKSDNKTI
ncbi:MAG: tRNA (guanosine(37)-N1)-methyltransferase TrmD [Tenacibaculum sp.]